MELVSPLPLRSPQDPAVSNLYKGYDMTSPLHADGSDFKCKRYQYSDTNPQADDIKAVYQAGNTYNITLQGTATHNGGSCQISLSYDNGETFKVIKSIIGGCPLTLSYNFTIPTFAPSSNTVLLSWSWFNVVGNREMYQNCARVQVTGAGSQRHRRQARTYPMKRQTSFADLPDMFACNVANGCRTIEKREVVFPQPGSDVVYGQNEVAVESGPGFVIDGTPQSSTTSSTGVIVATSTTSRTSSTTPTFTNEAVAETTSTLISTSTFAVPPSSQFSPSATTTALFLLRNTSFTSLQESSASSSTTSINTLADTSSGVANVTSTTSSTTTLPTTQMTPTSSSPAFSASSSSSTFTSPFTFPSLPRLFSATTSPLPSGTPARSDPPPSSSPPTPSPTTLATSTLAPTFASTSTPTTPSTSTTTTPPAQSRTPSPLACTPGLFTCNTPTTFSSCVTTASGLNSYMFYGSVAPGTVCVDGSFVRENQGACTPDGELFCDGESAFFLCDHGGLIRMGPTAPGTVCKGGVIVAA